MGTVSANAALLGLLVNVGHASRMAPAHWEDTLRLARDARLLALLGQRLRASEAYWQAVPARPRGHLLAAIHHSDWHLQLMRRVLDAVMVELPADLPVVLLKGAAYLAQGLPIGAGRMPSDVDLLVRRDDLGRAEAALRRAGWASESLNAWDERYYREWSHELPPLRHADHGLELDLHHTITPVTSRVRADDALLYAGLTPLPGSRWLVLHPLDQVLHAVIHLFQDSDLKGQLRNLVDIDGLLRAHLRGAGDWEALVARAERHGAGRLLWYALAYCREWLDTPVPGSLALPAPGPFSRTVLDWIFRRSCPPRLPDARPAWDQRLAALAGTIRYHRMRMPAPILVRHVVHKVAGKLSPARGAAGRE